MLIFEQSVLVRVVPELIVEMPGQLWGRRGSGRIVLAKLRPRFAYIVPVVRHM